MIHTPGEVNRSDENQRSQAGMKASEANLCEKKNVSCYKAVTDLLHKLKPILSSHQNVLSELFWSPLVGSFCISRLPSAESCSQGCNNLERWRECIQGKKEDKKPANIQNKAAYKWTIIAWRWEPRIQQHEIEGTDVTVIDSSGLSLILWVLIHFIQTFCSTETFPQLNVFKWWKKKRKKNHQMFNKRIIGWFQNLNKRFWQHS